MDVEPEVDGSTWHHDVVNRDVVTVTEASAPNRRSALLGDRHYCVTTAIIVRLATATAPRPPSPA